MKPVKFLRASATVEFKRIAPAQGILIGGIPVAKQPDIANLPALDGSLFLCAMAARNKAPPTLVTVEQANGLALQLIKA